MYLLDKETELTSNILGKILNQFNTQDRPKLQRL